MALLAGGASHRAFFICVPEAEKGMDVHFTYHFTLLHFWACQ